MCTELVNEGTNKVQLKEMVTTALVESLTPIREEMTRLEKDQGRCNSISQGSVDQIQLTLTFQVILTRCYVWAAKVLERSQ